MKKIFTLLLCAICYTGISAQNAREEIYANRQLAGSNYLAYPGPQKKLSPAPKGKKPFYISHYGRHGSRFLIGRNDYDRAWKILMKADSANALTAYGKDVLRRVDLIRKESDKRLGELTPLGAEQHRGIGARMYERFPEVFKGDVSVDAKSTVVIRCILSMENELHSLLIANPKLHITHDASEHDMYYMNLDDRKLGRQKMPKEVRETYDAFCKNHTHTDRLMGKLFSDQDYLKNHVDISALNYHLFKLASNVQSTEIRHQLNLDDLFTQEEAYENWLQSNAWWYINYGPSPLNGGTQPFTQRNLLRNMIEQADSCLKLERPGATLRFGHEVCVMPLACLMELNNCGQQIFDLEELAPSGWFNYRIFPMACNVQIIFYRKNLEDKDILVKVLLNEDEATLPIKTDNAPYYKWEDVRSYYLKKLDSYQEK